MNALLIRARELGFQSTNLDLIYGLPLQNVESFMFTLHKVIELNPDRLKVSSTMLIYQVDLQGKQKLKKINYRHRKLN